MNNNDTIFALSSGHGKSGVAVIRVSGDDLYNLFLQITNRKSADTRHAYFANFRDTSGDLIDQVIAVYFAAPHSFTGTDIIEIYSHGAPAVVNKIFEYFRDMGGRMATPGEFSRRAFYNNKMDLTDIDGLAALLDAQTDAQRKSALASMLGGDSEIYNAWRHQMIEISAYAAAILDYADDELPTNIGDTIRKKTKKLYDEISTAISHHAAVRAIRSGFNIALVGRTNVGKSSLFNAILGANRAIVSDIPGTTRDVVSATLDIGGYMVNLSDTAGIRRATDTIEKIGIARTKSEIENADIIINVQSAKNKLQIPSHAAPNTIYVTNKSDAAHTTPNIRGIIYTSAKTGTGIKKLITAINKKISAIANTAESSVAVNARTRGLLSDAATELNNALNAPVENYDIFAEHTRRAADAIGKILGTITANDVLDATFSQLCLGK